MERKYKLLLDRRVLCWAMYDWANSAYTTLIITVLIAYIQRCVFPASIWGSTGPVVWAWAIAASMFLGAVLSPIVGAMADAQNGKRRWLALTALTGSGASVMLGLIPTNHYVVIVCLFILANLCLELSLGVYNGFLPEIVDESDVNFASAWGYGLGYLGGGIALLMAMGLMQFGDSLGLPSMESRLRASLVFMGVWWALFTLPAILVLGDRTRSDSGVDRPDASFRTSFVQSLREVMSTLRRLRTNVPLAFFLLSFLFYNDGMQTIISQASTFALSELQMPEMELMGVILMIQFLAMPGAIGVGLIADHVGKKPTLLGCLAVWGLTLIAALWITGAVGFWLLAAVIALVLGGTQAVSRSLMTEMIPNQQNAQYFGFFNLSGKATSFIGTFLFGAIIAATGSSRIAIVGLLPLFMIGALLLGRVRVPTRVDE